ncbi:MAG: hypothetical protein H5T70_01405 [Chloroflexi bacterium]|nr:hypothetical protein [Chloroflexota bacterium]MBC7315062.1 hypothetical protein [Chloroflexota bacterium]
MVGKELDIETLEALRDVRYHRTPALRVTNERAARAFVDEVGFCFLFGNRNIEMPTFWNAIAGSRGGLPEQHHDVSLDRAWEWKDTLPARGEIYYAKILCNTATLVSLELVPVFYALSPNYGDVEDYLEQYEAGQMTAEAKNIYEALLKEGAMATSRLRQVAGLAGGGAVARSFERAIAELQAEMKIVKVGISDANRWGYAYVYDLFLRRFPDVPEKARAISTDQAMDTLLLRYLRNVIAVPEAMARRLFRWDDWEWGRLMERLSARGLIRRDVRIRGLEGVHLALADFA